MFFVYCCATLLCWLALAWVIKRYSIGALASRIDFSNVKEEDLRFPKPIFWGAATAAHQAEGNTPNNNWTQWESHTRADGRNGIFNGDKCGKASNHWELFESDVKLMKQLGLTMYRFSIEWSRIEPKEGEFDTAALDRYINWCKLLRSEGIEPMVTLHHFTDPLWIVERGGWENESTIDAFIKFVEFVVPRMAHVVDLWVTINEPIVYTLMGYATGEFPPGKMDINAALLVLRNLLIAHGRAYHEIHRLDTVDADKDGIACQVGLANNMVLTEANNWWNPVDVAMATLFDDLYNNAIHRAITTGVINIKLFFGNNPISRMLPHVYEVSPALADTIDFVGVNHYQRMFIGIDFRKMFSNLTNLINPMNWFYAGFDPTFDTATQKNDMGWDLTPHSLYACLMKVKYLRKPVFITESGTCDGEEPDNRRVRYLRGCLFAVKKAIESGVDIRGYIHWSFLDNFEWAHGFTPRFGLFRVDYSTQERRITEGGKLYRRVIANNRL